MVIKIIKKTRAKYTKGRNEMQEERMRIETIKNVRITLNVNCYCQQN